MIRVCLLPTLGPCGSVGVLYDVKLGSAVYSSPPSFFHRMLLEFIIYTRSNSFSFTFIPVFFSLPKIRACDPACPSGSCSWTFGPRLRLGTTSLSWFTFPSSIRYASVYSNSVYLGVGTPVVFSSFALPFISYSLTHLFVLFFFPSFVLLSYRSSARRSTTPSTASPTLRYVHNISLPHHPLPSSFLKFPLTFPPSLPPSLLPSRPPSPFTGADPRLRLRRRPSHPFPDAARRGR